MIPRQVSALHPTLSAAFERALSQRTRHVASSVLPSPSPGGVRRAPLFVVCRVQRPRGATRCRWRQAHICRRGLPGSRRALKRIPATLEPPRQGLQTTNLSLRSPHFAKSDQLYCAENSVSTEVNSTGGCRRQAYTEYRRLVYTRVYRRARAGATSFVRADTCEDPIAARRACLVPRSFVFSFLPSGFRPSTRLSGESLDVPRNNLRL